MKTIKTKYLGELSKEEIKKVGEYLADDWALVDICGISRVKDGFPTYLMSYQDRTSDRDSCGYKHISDFYVYSGYNGHVVDESATHILRNVMQCNSVFGKEYAKDLEKIEAIENAVRQGKYLLVQTVKNITEMKQTNVTKPQNNERNK